MSYNKYRNKYSKNLSQKLKMRNLKWFIVAVVVLVILLFVLLRGDSDKDVVKDDGSSIVPLPKDVVVDGADKDESSAKKADKVDKQTAAAQNNNQDVKKTTSPNNSPAESVKAKVEETKSKTTAAAANNQEGSITAPADQAQKLMQQASAQIKSGRVVLARETLNKVLALNITSLERERIKKELTRLAKMWLFSKSVFPGDNLTSAYQVQSGDNLVAIGSRYKVPAEFLMRINGIDDARKLRAGQSIKVVNGPFNVVVSKSIFTLDVYLQNTYIKSYKVGTGLPGKDTPTGKWKVKRDGKLITPPWPNPEGGIVYPEDPEYPLGSRWIGIEGIEGPAKLRSGFGIHGTKDPETIGTQSSQGCVRLYNGEVIELYDMLVSQHSMILIRE